MEYYFEKKRNVAIIAGKNSPKKLYHILKKHGHQVSQYAAYRRNIACQSIFALDTPTREQITTLTCHSAMSLTYLHTAINLYDYPQLLEKNLVVITQAMYASAINLGFQKVFCSADPTPQAILEQLLKIHATKTNHN